MKREYNKGKIVLSSEDYIDTEIKTINDSIVVNMERMWNTAQAFELTAQRCEIKIQKDNNICEFLPLPAIVNRAFACEVYFKILNILENRKIANIHNLSMLFNNLPQDIKNIIKEKVNNPNFDEELEKIKKAFISMRYSYELEQFYVNMEFIKQLHDSLEIITKQLIEKRNS